MTPPPGGVIWRVTCGDGVVRHGLHDLVTDEQADEFADRGHRCTWHHDFALVCELCLQPGHTHAICPHLLRWKSGQQIIATLTRAFDYDTFNSEVGLDLWAGQLYDVLSNLIGSALCEPYSWQFDPTTMNDYARIYVYGEGEAVR